MSFQYSCFISYPALDGVQPFITALHEALRGHLAFFIDQDIFFAPVSLDYGVRFNPRLAEAICRSVCWVVVYSPIYAQRPYCLKEYAAMEQVEARRMEVLKRRLGAETRVQQAGMIIPIILRGRREHIPLRIRDNINYCDLSGYSLANPQMLVKETCDDKLRSIAQYIYDCYINLQPWQEEMCDGCGSYELPTEEQIQPLIVQVGQLLRPHQPLPFRR